MKNIFASIIIPTYNPNLVFLNELFSVFKDYDDSTFEILVVDDGSKEEKAAEISKLCNKFNLKYFGYNDNKGVSYARNLGIENSIGKYLIFCDCDDILNFELIKKLSKEKLDENLYFFHLIENLNFPVTSNLLFSIIDSSNMRDYFLSPRFDGLDYSFRGCVGKLVKRDLVIDNKIRFNDKLRYCEDTAFVLECISFAKKINIANGSSFYSVRYNAASVSRQWNNDYNALYFSFFNYITSKIKDKDLLFPVFKDTVCIYSKVRICTSFKHFKIKQGMNFIKSSEVFTSCTRLSEYNVDLDKEQSKFIKLILRKKYFKAYFYIVIRRILFKILG